MQKIILSALLLSMYSYVLADEIVTLENGKKAILKDNGSWSYIISQSTIITEEYKNISLSELKLTITSLEDKKIKTQALAQVYNFMITLKQNMEDAIPLTVNINSLSKEERKKIQTECKNGCKLTVFGRVGNVMYDEKGIIADKILW